MFKSLRLGLAFCAVSTLVACSSDGDTEPGSGGSSGSTAGGSSGGGAGGDAGSGGSDAGTGGGGGTTSGGSAGSAGAGSGGTAGQGSGGTTGQAGSSGSGGAGGLAKSAVDDCRHADMTTACTGTPKPYYWECDKNPSATPPAAGCEQTSPSRWCCPDPFCTRYIGGDSLCAGVYPSTPTGYICAKSTPGTEACKSLPSLPNLFCCA
jgi:hypothetical protein